MQETASWEYDLWIWLYLETWTFLLEWNWDEAMLNVGKPNSAWLLQDKGDRELEHQAKRKHRLRDASRGQRRQKEGCQAPEVKETPPAILTYSIQEESIPLKHLSCVQHSEWWNYVLLHFITQLSLYLSDISITNWFFTVPSLHAWHVYHLWFGEWESHGGVESEEQRQHGCVASAAVVMENVSVLSEYVAGSRRRLLYQSPFWERKSRLFKVKWDLMLLERYQITTVKTELFGPVWWWCLDGDTLV